MTESPNTRGDAGGFLLRQWPIVVAAMLVAAIAGALWARAGEDPAYTSTVRLRVSSNISNVQNAPSADSVVSTALRASTKRAAAASSGVDPEDFSVGAEVDAKNRLVVSVRVEAADADTAVGAATAVAAATRESALRPLEPFIADQLDNAQRFDAFGKQLGALLADAEAGAKRAPIGTSENAAYLGNRVNLTQQRFNAEDRVAESRYLVTLARNYVSVDGEPVTTRASDTTRTAAGLVQGAVLGLLAGLVLAYVREGLQRRRA